MYKRTSNRIFRPRDLSLICQLCHEPFTQQHGSGVFPKYCGAFCRTRARLLRARSQPLCIIEGCRLTSAYKSGLCNSHYDRVRRTGTLEARIWAYRRLHTAGYVVLSGKLDGAHPLAVNGRVFEHRKILFDAIGWGPHTCHWCGENVEWQKKVTRRKGNLVPDHLDADVANNSRENLVPACNSCNLNRGTFMAWLKTHADDPALWKLLDDLKAKSKSA